MRPSSSAEETAGYRDVGFNLRVVTAEALAALLGVDGHVCEVQLLLLPFAKIKSDEGHKCEKLRTLLLSMPEKGIIRGMKDIN
mmetsp:Transcript_27192/g.56500  ORF Transcript_27192/g.56500 Transcript_27192/m.56500 type:complete len:83 (+) Transcript_27192:212-460(+)